MKVEYRINSFEILIDFLDYMWNVKGKSEKTINEYYLDLRTLFRFLKVEYGLVEKGIELEKININDIDTSFLKRITFRDLASFLSYVANERNNNKSTRARKISTIKSFFKFVTQKKLILDKNPAIELEIPKRAKTLPKYLSIEQSIELLNAVDGKFAKRDYCILTLLLNCGMRLSELVGINYGDYNLEQKTLKLHGKGDKTREIYINDACVEAIISYYKVRPVIENVDTKKALFISRQNNRLSPKSVQLLVYKYLEKIGLEGQGYSVHKLRHTAATLMFRQGDVDIRVIKDVLGHENLSTTQIYTHVSDEQMKRATETNPLNKIRKKQ